MSSDNNKAKLERLIEQVWNRGQLGLVESLIAPQYTVHQDPGDPWEGRTLNREEYRERVAYSRRVFPDLCFTIGETVAENDRVAILWRLSGTQLGDIIGIPATGKAIDVAGLTIYYASDQGFSGHRQLIDRFDVLQQLGVFPGLSQA